MNAAPPVSADLVDRLLATDEPGKRRALVEGADLPVADLHDAVLRLVDAAEQLLGVDPPRMERICLDAAALAERTGEDYLRAMVRMRYGDALRVQGRNAAALACYDEAAALFKLLGRPVEAARTRIGWVFAAASLGRHDAAIRAARRARRVLLQHGQVFRVAILDQNTGNSYVEQGRYHAALRRFTRALALFDTLGEQGRLGAARCHQNRGLALTRLGRYREALPELELAREAFLLLGEIAGYARATRTIGQNAMDQGRYTAALRAFEEARPRFQALGMATELVLTARDVADCYLYLNRPTDALTVLRAAEADLQGTDNVQDALALRVRLVTALLLLEEREQAAAVLDEADQRYSTGAAQHRSWLSVQRAALLLRDGVAPEALSAAQLAHRLARSAGMRRLAADALILAASAQLVLGMPKEAGRTAARACALARAVDAAPLLYRAHEVLGQVAEARAWPAVARRHYAAAVHQLEREQRGVIFEFRDSFAASRGLAYERLAVLQLQAGRAADALATAERAKSRALADAIAGAVELRPRPGLPAAARRLLRDLAGAREEYAAAAARLAREGAEGGEPTPEGRAAAARGLEEMEAGIAQLIRRLQLAGAADDLAGLCGVALPPDLPSLPPDTALLEFFFSGDDVLRFVVDRSGVHGDLLPDVAPEIERLLRIFRNNLDTTERASRDRHEQLAERARLVLGRLHTALLGGLEGLQHCRSLVIVPHGLLHYLPFHALHDGARYLVERWAISYAPSAALYGICNARSRQRARAGGALVLAHTAGERLPYTRAEAEAVAAVLGAPVHESHSATRGLLQSAGRTAGLIHIAAHGSFRTDAPLFSCVELADGPLTTADVFSLDLRAALVTLSACETGRSVLGGGDELAGLTRAFLYAGAAGLLVSQWRVDDASTAALMASFYRHLAAGAGRADALRAAQLEMIAAMPQTGASHPFYWAGFHMIGDNQPALRPPR